MKKNLLLAGLLTTFSLVAKSQVGINTSNPQGIFNIDGLKNNPATGVPTAAQTTDDFVVTSNGNVGVGTVSPTNKLVVKGVNAQPSALGTVNTNAALRVDGNTNHALDLGTYANSPFGSYISSQNKTAAAGLPLVLNPVGGNVGIAIDSPGTALDVNGAITNRETALTVAGNAVTIPANVSQVQLTGAATATVTITAPVAPNAGQRIIVYNNTTGGFGATLGGVTIPNGKALEYVYSNSGWRSTDGGSVGAPAVNLYTADGTLTGNRTVTQGANTLTFTGTQTNAFSVDGNTLSVDAANDRLGIGTTTPSNKLHVEGSQLLNAAVTTAQTKNALDINVGQDGFSYGNRAENFGINMRSSSSAGTGPISRINFGDISTTTATGNRYLSFSVGQTPNELMYLTDANSGRVGIGTVSPTNKLVVAGINAQPSALGTANTNATFRIDGNTSHALDFGTYTSAPFGSYISSQNKTSTTGLPLVLNPVGGNVGVGTNAPDNSALLDLTATDRGFLPPRVSLTSVTDGATIPSPAKGLIVFNSNTALTPYGEGVYTNSGTPAAPKWDKLAPQTTDYQLLGVFTGTATFPVDQLATGNGVIINNLNLGLSVSVTVPANSTAKIVVDYNVPVGSTNTVGSELGYFGVRFLRNGVEAPAGSRKYTIPEGDNGSQMVSTVGKYSESFNNTSASPVTITYTLNGYAESTNHPIRFNMWAASGQNFNWGVGSISATAFAKDN